MASTSVSDLVDHFRIDTQIQKDCTLEIIQTVQPRGRRIVRTEKRWTKQTELGYGTFGEVWLERNQKGETRAVKGVRKRKDTGIDYYKELLAMAKLSKHLQLFVEFFGWYETVESLFIAMEYFEYGDLHKHVLGAGPCSEHDAQIIAYQLLEGLGVMHEMGFAHRDLKPQNIFVAQPSPEWWIKIGDFGIAKRVQATDETALRTEIGTRSYRAPEVDGILDEDAEEYTSSVDIWSLGCVIFWVLTQQIPFPSRNRVYEFVRSRADFPTGPLRKKSVGDACLKFLQRTIAIQPKRRLTVAAALDDIWLKDVDSGSIHKETLSVDEVTAQPPKALIPSHKETQDDPENPLSARPLLWDNATHVTGLQRATDNEDTVAAPKHETKDQHPLQQPRRASPGLTADLASDEEFENVVTVDVPSWSLRKQSYNGVSGLQKSSWTSRLRKYLGSDDPGKTNLKPSIALRDDETFLRAPRWP